MSLSFIKSAVLSSTDGVSHNEETKIDNKETHSLRASGGGGHKPLFEQLRANKEAEQEKYEEFQRSMRGTRTLDEEDCAHLDAVERTRGEREYAVKSGIEREVALFHASREDWGLAQAVMHEGQNDNDAKEMVTNAAVDPSGDISREVVKSIVPKFTIKKKRQRVSQELDSNDDVRANKIRSQKKENTEYCYIRKENTKGAGNNELSASLLDKSGEDRKSSPPKVATNNSDSDDDGGGLLGLGCYGSDSD